MKESFEESSLRKIRHGFRITSVLLLAVWLVIGFQSTTYIAYAFEYYDGRALVREC